MAQRARWVIKIGSALLTNDGRGLDRDLMQTWVDRIVALRERGIDVMVVSSGAVAEGMTRLGWARRPDSVHQLQAAAAVGQMGLVQAWESCFQKPGPTGWHKSWDDQFHQPPFIQSTEDFLTQQVWS